VIFTSDHGYFYGEHCLGPERRLAYEEAIRIPLLVRYPMRFAPGRRPDNFVSSSLWQNPRKSCDTCVAGIV
jgi:arylsulfatase A-like enzyme